MALVLSACATRRESYYEPPSEAGFATIVNEDSPNAAVTFLTGNRSVYPWAIDGVLVRDAYTRGAEPLPLRAGPRRVVVAQGGGGGGFGTALIEFEAQPGVAYVIQQRQEGGAMALLTYGYPVFVWLEEAKSRAKVTAEVSLVMRSGRENTIYIPMVVPKRK